MPPVEYTLLPSVSRAVPLGERGRAEEGVTCQPDSLASANGKYSSEQAFERGKDVAAVWVGESAVVFEVRVAETLSVGGITEEIASVWSIASYMVGVFSSTSLGIEPFSVTFFELR